MSGFGERLTQRQKGFKKATDADEARRKREDAAIQLRKQVKDEALLKKRMVSEQVGNSSGDIFSGAINPASVSMDPQRPHAEQLSQMPSHVQALNSDDFEAVFNATQWFRKLLSIENNPPISEVIHAGIMPRFVTLLKEISRPQLQFEAAWVLTNIASGNADQTRVVVEHGALPLFVELLQSPSEDVREQAVWALGNIAGDCATFRDLVLQSGGLAPVMRLISDSAKVSVTRNATWTLSNLCRGKPQPPLEWVVPALSTFKACIHATDVEVVTDACWALSYLSDGANDRIQAVIEHEVCPRLVELLSHQANTVQTPALRACGNIVTGDTNQTQHMLTCGILPPLLQLLSHSKKTIRKEACWTISNITAGTPPQIQDVLNNGLIPPVVNLLQNSDFDIKKEAAWAISNATAGGSPEQIEYLVECGCIKPLCDLLTCNDSKITEVGLDALENILKVGQAKQAENGLPENPVMKLIEQADGLQHIEDLQQDSNEVVYSKAVKLLEYWPIEDEDVADQGTGLNFQMPQGGFNFGA